MRRRSVASRVGSERSGAGQPRSVIESLTLDAGVRESRVESSKFDNEQLRAQTGYFSSRDGAFPSRVEHFLPRDGHVPLHVDALSSPAGELRLGVEATRSGIDATRLDVEQFRKGAGRYPTVAAHIATRVDRFRSRGDHYR